VAEQREVLRRAPRRAGRRPDDRRQVELDEVVEAPVVGAGARRDRAAVAAEIGDQHVEAGRGERAGEAPLAARAEVAAVGHHRVQADDRAARRALRAQAIDVQRHAVRGARLELVEHRVRSSTGLPRRR
jgi:hypothetical protein